MTWIEALILGIIQGLTEFLPVSSSGHLELGSVILGTRSEDNLLFAVVVHAATAMSTILVFWRQIVSVFAGLLKFQWNESYDFSIKIAISMVPVGVVGVFFEDQVEALFGGNLLLVGSMLLITALLLTFTHFRKPGDSKVTYGKSVLIGLAQAMAIMPGISRSGATIATALIAGVLKSNATQFSFLMVLPPILGASLLKMMDYLEAPNQYETLALTPLVVGFMAAFVAGYLACRWMISIVQQGKLTYFAVYCAIIGMIAIVSSFVI